MQLKVNKNDNRLATEISIESDIYDGIIPIKTLRIEHLIENINPDRFAIASVLIFKPYVCGQIIFPTGCSPEVAKGIERFLKPIDTSVSTVNPSPFPKPIGYRKALILEDTTENNETYVHEDDHDLKFKLSSSHQFKSYISIDEMHISSNLNAVTSDDMCDHSLGLLGLCVLCAEDAVINTISIKRLNANTVHNFDQLLELLVLSNIFIDI